MPKNFIYFKKDINNKKINNILIDNYLKNLKKIIVVGGTGFIGFHIINFFKKKKWEVISISRNKYKKKRFVNNVKYIYVDISNKIKLYKKLSSLKNVKYIINAGGEVDHKNKKKVYQSHLNGVKNLADFYSNQNLKKFTQIGSSLEYGKKKSPHCETLNCKPVSFYAKAKFAASNYLLNLYWKKKFPIIIIRPYQVYGPNQDINRFMPIIINNCLKGAKFPCSDGKQKRDFLYIKDFINAIYLLTIKKDNSGEIFNIGSGKPKRLRDIVNKIVKKIKKGSPHFGIIKMRKEEDMITYPKIKKVFKSVNWLPKTKLYEGLNKTIKYYQ